MRPPISAVRILLPVWGKEYVEQFLDFCLPTLLADGNLPSLCRRTACTFVLFARTDDVEAIRGNPGWRALEDMCAVEIATIDHLISASHSTTITLAYVSGIRSCKSDLLDTCFIFLVSDYVLADGALSNVLARVVAGASGVLAGNFQIVGEGAAPVLAQARAGGPYLSIQPRDLIRLALDHLHPATIANFADSPVRHDAASNRLFWRVDDSTILGRFYLMHMIAIRPETAEFIIAAPSDYSLIPELCPSGAVATIEDSDEYCVVELQSRRQGQTNLRLGPLTPAAVATSLSNWATGQHRENAGHAIVFHSDKIKSEVAETIAASKRFISEVERHLPSAPQPFRYHPYWCGAIDHHERTSPTPVDFPALSKILGDPNFAIAVKSARAIRLRAMLLGRAPDFRPWHPRWLDVQRFWIALKQTAGGASIIIVGDIPALLRRPIELRAQAYGARRVDHADLREIRDLTGRSAANPGERFDVCVLILSPRSLEAHAAIVEQFVPIIQPAGRILLVIGDLFEEASRSFGPDRLTLLPISATSGLQVEEFRVVGASPGRLLIQSTMMALARSSFGGGLRSLLRIAGAGMLAIVSGGLNVGALLRSQASEQSQCSSVALTLRLRSPEGHNDC
ncbi:hypothetical protein [Methylocapsa sp. S129]|uniref:hypothetical protein n=1 Tax=Methylocapsa sp. S129 TaxID=1641869 RepID=UPI00131B3BC5|nr:hypothetical protein [Methylocapsa sp. S129]